MNRLFLITFWLYATTAVVGAQVHELWRTGLTNTSSYTSGQVLTNYLCSVALVDTAGNTVVGGSVERRYGYPREGVLAKFGPHGEGLWIYVSTNRLYTGIEAVAVTSAGTVLFTARAASPPYPLQLTALGPGGAELWTVAEPSAAGDEGAVSSVAVDGAGNIVWLGWRVFPVEPEGFGSERFLAKYAPDGQRLWRLALPPADYQMTAAGLARTLQVTADGSIFVTGGLSDESGRFRGFVAGISADGDLRWYREPTFTTNEPMWAFSSIVAGTHGTVCVGSTYEQAVFTTDGGLVSFGTWFTRGTVVTSPPDGGFLLSLAEYSEALHERLDSQGRLLWRTRLGVAESFGTVQDGYGGWLSAGGPVDPMPGDVAGLVMTRLDENGNRLWSRQMSSYHFDPPWWALNDDFRSVLRAPDGTYRLVMNESSWLAGGTEGGITVAAFFLEDGPFFPRILAAPEPVAWDGSNDVHFTVNAEGASALRYQWFLMRAPIPGATNASFIIPAAAVPSSRGFIHVRVDDTNGYVLSRAVNLHCGRIWLNVPTPADLAGQPVNVFSDIDVPFQIERSTDLINWEPVPGTVESFNYAISADIPSLGGAFYRAVVLPLGSPSSSVPGFALPRKGFTASQR